MKRVFTITSNLMSEYTLQLDSSKIPNKNTHRAIATSHQVGGKGINVSRTLSVLGQDNTAICLPAGKEGEKCVEALKAENIDIAPIYIRGESRIGTVLKSKNGKKQASFFSNDIEIKPEDFDKIIDYLEQKAKNFDVVAICGSIPNFSENFGKKLLKLAKKKSLSLCVDTYGKALEFFSDKELVLLKVNKDELMGLRLLKSTNTKKNFLALEKTSKAQFLAITDGKNPAFLYADGVSTKHKVARVKLKSATGCGDLVFAFMINSIFNGATSIRQVFESALSYATKTALKNQ